MNKIPKPKNNLVNKKFGHWIVKEQDIEMSKKIKRVCWRCECDCGCGTEKTLRTDALKQITVGGCNNMAMLTSKKCLKCGKDFFPKKQAKTRKYCYDCMPEENNIEKKTSIRNNIKKWSIEYKGGKCQCCNYKTCNEALEFHHINPEEKDFNISDRDIKLDWNLLKKELDKCILVCANCHREIHAGVRNIIGGDYKNVD